jgi:uncharacterized protein (TIGR02246 family)
MRRTRPLAAPLIVLAVSLAACQPAPNGAAAARAAGDSATATTAAPAAAPLSSADEAAVRGVDSAWAASIEKGDAAAAGALYADDAVMLGSDAATLSGKGEIGKELDGFAKAGAKNVKVTPTKVDGRGDLAYSYGTWSMTMGGKPAAGKYAEVFRRQPDGSWKYVVDSWSFDPAPKKP